MRRSLIVLATGLVLAAVATGTAAAHPLGNFSVNQLVRVEAGPDALRLRVIVDTAEIPTAQARPAVDADGDGAIGPDELARERDRAAREVLAGLAVRVDDAPAAPALRTAELTYPAGGAGLPTSRLELVLDLPVDAAAPHAVAVASTFAADRIGWRDVVAAAAPGSAVDRTTAAQDDPTALLTTYPAAALEAPRRRTEATVEVRPGTGGLQVVALVGPPPAPAAVPAEARSGDRLAELVEGRTGSLLGLLGAFGAAALLGMLHALTPGHGKTMVAAYLAGSRGSARHAFALGATVTITHTASVFAFGLVTLSLSAFILPEQLYPWLELAAGALVLAIGLSAIRQRLRAARRERREQASAAPHGHSHGHVHGHSHGHSHGHVHGHSHGHAHGHSHAAPAEGITWRSLIALGVSGGLLPCPSALVVLLGAIALHRVAFGMALIVAFSLGLAAVISGIGLAVLSARSLLQRVPGDHGRGARIASVASACIVTCLGVALVLRAVPGVV